MGFFDEIKAFVHSITTDDHYASFESPYKNSTISNGSNSQSRLHELGRLAHNNSSTQSFSESRNSSSSNIPGGHNPGVVGYRPGMRSSTTNLSDVQLQNLNSSGQPPLPLIDSLWNRISNWVDEEYPELGDNLNYGVTTADLNEFENDIGCGALPIEFRQFYKIVDGQMRGGQPTGLILGLTLLDIESIAEEYKIWGKVAVRLEKQQYMMQHQSMNNGPSSSSSPKNPFSNNFLSNQKSLPPQAVQCVYSHKGWIPFVKDDVGNMIAIDLAPGPLGQWGQIIIFGREFDTKVVIASSFQEFIFNYVTDLEVGNFQIDQDEVDESFGLLESSRDDDDYRIGAEEENQGDLSFYDRGGKEFGKLKRTLTYLEVWKRRALKKYGINNVDQFSTTFVPQRIKKNPKTTTSIGQDELKVGSSPQPRASSPLIHMESSLSLPKETLIDEDKPVKKEIKEQRKEEDSKEEPKKEEPKKEEPKKAETEKESKTVEEPKNEEGYIKEDDKKVEVKEEQKDELDEVTDDMKEVEL